MKKNMLALLFLFMAFSSLAFTHSSRAASVKHTTQNSCIDIPAEPDYLSSGTLDDAIEALNNARAIEHLPPLKLPAIFEQLDAAHQQLILINLERTDRGLSALKWDDNLAQIATAYSKQLRDLNFFSHTSPIGGTFNERAESNTAVSGHYSYVAENLAGNPVASAGAVYEYMYNDSAEHCGHRNNILNKTLNLVGIGVVDGGEYGSMSAQEFLASAPWNPYKTVKPNTIAPAIAISTGKTTNGLLPLTACVATKSKVARITWFIDSLKSKAQIGTTIKLDVKRMSRGLHKIFAFAVDGVQNFGSTQIQVSI